MDLSESWKQQFFKLFPIIPAVLQLIGAFIIIILGCFGEIHVGTPWWSGILFVVSGASLCLLFKWPLVRLELFAFATVVLSILAAAAAVIVYALEFSVPQLFPHDHSDPDHLVLTYHVDVSVLALCSFELGISVWILSILILSRKAENH
ncbi:hypothetical protein XENTR_v10016398 [Xenopus tropicalis]|nr:hypothetical protein XENTR_v10016398 [Xenopus tropicalis]